MGDAAADDLANDTTDDRAAGELDDERDRVELRSRYYGLLQELRVLLPGTQVIVAFLLTVPFNNRFTEVDDLGRDLYGIALGGGALAIIMFVAPTVFHRVAPRRSRSQRLVWGIRLTRVGLVFLATSLTASIALVTRIVYGSGTALVIAIAVSAALTAVWLVLPLLGGESNVGRNHR
jgi:hypothetical protein